MRKKRTIRATKSFRYPLPQDLTEVLRERLMALPESVKTDYLKAEVFSKFVSKDTDPSAVRRQRAINKWLATERENEGTNVRLLLTEWDYNILPRVTFREFMDFCRDVIVDIIGDTPPVEALIGSFSGGASTSRSRTRSHPASKYVGKAHVTSRCWELFDDCIIEETPNWWLALGYTYENVDVVPGNVMFTVPKNTDIDRCACKEPDLNMFVQKGIGDYFRKSLLKRARINLNDQSINRSLAQQGSETKQLATLDLSSASDSMTYGLVQELLPVTWFTLLDSVRSPVTIIDGEEHRNEMFSSMGNGFTFELQTLLFYALMRTTAYFCGISGVVSVYGDDIIIPTALSDKGIWVLNYMGFQVNPDKSHVEGPIRESCGGHYWNGFDITPFYVKAPIESLPDLIDVANKLREWGSAPIGPRRFAVIDPDVEEIWLWLKSLVPSRFWGGVDTSFKYQLVSFDVPNSRLYEDGKTVSTGPGGYIHWLNTTWARSRLSEAVMTSSKRLQRNTLRVRPVADNTVPRLECLFLHEIDRLTEKEPV